RLLRLALDDDAAVQVERAVLPLRLLEPIDDDGARERNLVARQLQQLLADDLGREETLRLIRQVVGRIARLPFRQTVENDALETIDVVPRPGGHGNDLGELPHLAVL